MRSEWTRGGEKKRVKKLRKEDIHVENRKKRRGSKNGCGESKLEC